MVNVQKSLKNIKELILKGWRDLEFKRDVLYKMLVGQAKNNSALEHTYS